MERVVGLVNKLQQIASALGDTAASENSVLWNKLTTIVVIGGQRCVRGSRQAQLDSLACISGCSSLLLNQACRDSQTGAGIFAYNN